MGQGLRDYRDSERAHTVCGTLPCLRGRGPAHSGSTRTGQDRAEQDSAHTGDEQPPDRGGFSAPSQPLTSHIPLLHLPKGVPEQPERSETQSRWEKRGLGTSGKGFAEIEWGMQQLIGNAARRWRWWGYGSSGGGGRAVSRWSWHVVPEPSEGGEGPMGTKQAAAGQENHRFKTHVTAGCYFCPRRLLTDQAAHICPVA